MQQRSRNYLKRLGRSCYQGQAYVHWILTTQNRKTGWLKPIFYYKFRELLTHAAFRYQLGCPIYCCMPDHIHMIWIGLSLRADQLNAMKYLRKQLTPVLCTFGVRLQTQAFDHVLTEAERERDAFECVVEYIARNPERKGLVSVDEFRRYKYTGCLYPGYPELKLFEQDSWDRLWRIQNHLMANGTEALIQTATDHGPS